MNTFRHIVVDNVLLLMLALTATIVIWAPPVLHRYEDILVLGMPLTVCAMACAGVLGKRIGRQIEPVQSAACIYIGPFVLIASMLALLAAHLYGLATAKVLFALVFGPVMVFVITLITILFAWAFRAPNRC